MKRLKKYFVPGIFAIVALIFFYKVFFGLVPFPGDLLLAEYTPWKYESYLGYVPGSMPHKAQYFDVIRQLYPWRILAMDLMKQGVLPLWNPYNFSGTPLFANGQAAAFYPLNFLFFILPDISAWTILVILQPFLSSIFTYFYMRKIGVSIFGSILTSVAFSYSLYASTFLEYNTLGHVILWLPLILLSIEKIVSVIYDKGDNGPNFQFSIFNFQIRIKKVISWSLVMVFSIVASLFAGHLQVFGYVMVFSILYIVFRILSLPLLLKNKLRLGLYFIFLWTIGLGIGAVQLFPIIELIQLSSRVSHDPVFYVEQLLLQPYQYIMLFIPDIFGNPANRNYLLSASYPTKALYVGIPVILFALTALFDIKKNKNIFTFSVLGFFILMSIVRSPISEFLFRLNIPFLSSSSPSNGIFLLSFCISVLGGLGFDIWKKNKKILLAIITFSVIFSIFLCLTLFFGHAVNLKNILYSFAIILPSLGFFAILMRFPVKIQYLSIIFILITIFDLLYFFQKFNPFVPASSIYPHTEIVSYLKKNSGINRVWGYGSAYLEPNIQTQLRLYSPDGYDPLYLYDYGKFIQLSKDGKVHSKFDSFTRSNAAITPGYGSGDLMKNPYRLRMLDDLGVRYILAKSEEGDEKTFPIKRFKKLYEKNGLAVFENTLAIPRIFLFDGKDGFRLGNVVLKSYKSNAVEVQTNNKEESMLIISDTNFPGWKVYVDSKQESISTIYHVFRGVQVQGGKHLVRFVYEPDSFFWGLKVSIISLVLLIGVLILIYRKRYLLLQE